MSPDLQPPNREGTPDPIPGPRTPRGRARLFKALTLATGLTFAAVVGPGYLPPLNPTLQYDIERDDLGDYVFDYAVRPAPRVIMNLKANGKLTHDPDWIDTRIDPSFQCLKIEGDPGLMRRQNFFQGKWFEIDKYNWSKVQISLGAWWQAFQLKPKTPISSWHLKFQGLDRSGQGQKLRFGFTDAIRVLQGDGDYLACGEDRFGNEVPLDKTGPRPRWDGSIEGPLV